MRTYKEREITRIERTVDSIHCDMCKITMEIAPENVQHAVTIEHLSSKVLAGKFILSRLSLDICGMCFVNSIHPWLESKLQTKLKYEEECLDGDT